MNILIDSGAYSAFAHGFDIELGDYIAYIKNNQHFLQHYISLDVIPGKNGRRAADPKAVQRSYDNHLKMKAAGLSPWPVFHRQDDFRWLHRYLDDGEPYIALAPHPMSERHEVMAWLRACFAIVPSSIKVHGLGLTQAVMLLHFPFASVDSATWVNAASNGGILIPMYSRGRFDYSHRPYKISVSERSSWRSDHFDNLNGGFRREQVERFLAEVGVSLSQVRTSKPARMRVCIKYFAGLAACSNTQLFYVTMLESEQREVLSQCGAATRLLSFAELQNKRATALADYLTVSRTANRPNLKIMAATV